MSEFLSSISIFQYLSLITAVLAIIPTLFLLRLYYRTKLKDYLLFAGVYISLFSLMLLYFINNFLKFYFIMNFNHFLLNTTIFLLFIHGIRVKPKGMTSLVPLIGVIWFLVLQILIFFWVEIPVDRVTVLFFEMDPHPIIAENVSGITTGLQLENGIVIYGSSYPLLALMFYNYSFIVFLYKHATYEKVDTSDRVNRARLYWYLFGIIGLIATQNVYLNFLRPSEIMVPLLVIIQLGIVAYNSIKYPEAILLSKTQIFRAINLYHNIELNDLDEQEESVDESEIRGYIDTLIERFNLIPSSNISD